MGVGGLDKWGMGRCTHLCTGNCISGVHPRLMSMVHITRDPTLKPQDSGGAETLQFHHLWTPQSSPARWSPGHRWGHFQTRPPVLSKLCLSKAYTEMYLASAHFILISFRRRVINTRPVP